MRKVLLLVTVFALVLSAGNLFAQFNFNLSGVGGFGGYVSPEDPIGSTFGFGARANVGNYGDKIDLIGEFFYWSKTYDYGMYDSEWSWSQMYFNALAKYSFTSKGSITPYVIGGLGFVSGSWKWKSSYVAYNGSASDSEIGFNFGGGIDFKVSPNMDGFAEARFNTGEANMFGILGGVMVKLNK